MAIASNLNLACPLEVVEIVEGERDLAADHRDAVVGHEQDLLLADRGREPVALGLVQGEAAEVVVVGDPAGEAERFLGDRLEPPSSSEVSAVA